MIQKRIILTVHKNRYINEIYNQRTGISRNPQVILGILIYVLQYIYTFKTLHFFTFRIWEILLQTVCRQFVYINSFPPLPPSLPLLPFILHFFLLYFLFSLLLFRSLRVSPNTECLLILDDKR